LTKEESWKGIRTKLGSSVLSGSFLCLFESGGLDKDSKFWQWRVGHSSFTLVDLADSIGPLVSINPTVSNTSLKGLDKTIEARDTTFNKIWFP
jgi:hypothetical protein